jgi:hypothetical protein
VTEQYANNLIEADHGRLTRDHSSCSEGKGGPFMSPRLDLTVPHHPAVIDQFNKRAQDTQLRIADQITRLAGSMQFVYLHIALFTCTAARRGLDRTWQGGLAVTPTPWGAVEIGAHASSHPSRRVAR